MTRKSRYPAHFSGNIALYLYIIWICRCGYDLLFLLYYLFINNSGILGLRLRNPFSYEVSQSRYYPTYILFWDVLSSYQYKLHIEP